MVVALLAACGGDDPVRAKEPPLVGTWDLRAAQQVDGLEFAYTFAADGSVRNRVGGPFLAVLRDDPLVQQALQGEPLADVDLIDGGNLNWYGTWRVAGDSLTIACDRLGVEVFGRLPVVGTVTLPVHEQRLQPEAATQLGFTWERVGDELTLRGQALTVGVGPDGSAPADLRGPAVDAVAATAGFLADRLRDQGLDTHVFQRR